MIIQLHTPEGIFSIDPATITIDELAAFGLAPDAFANLLRIDEISQTLADCHSSHIIPPPDLSTFVLLICEYITRSQSI